MKQVVAKDSYAALLSPSAKVVSLVDVPEFKFLMVQGLGSPEGDDFQHAIQALYPITYGIRFWTKKHPAPKGYEEFKVSPLEGLWWVKDVDGPMSMKMPKDKWQWTAMIKQPDFVTQDLVDQVIGEAKQKHDNPAFGRVELKSLHEGQSVQIMHIGPYNTERETIEKMDAYMAEHDLASNGKHHEIYLGDPRRTKPEKLKTILRHPVKSAK